MKKQYHFATWLRTFSVTCILLCHFASQNSIPYIKMSGQILNIGVPLFIILSGFLFGRQYAAGGGIKLLDFYRKRLKRIYIPFELFLLVLAVIWIIQGKTVLTQNWLMLTLCMQGSVVGVLGADHTWFLTPLLMCYLITPPLFCLLRKVLEKKRYLYAFLTICLLLPVLFALFPPAFVSTLFTPLVTYSIAFLIGLRFDKVKRNAKVFFASFGLLCAAFLTRFALRIFLDGTIWYDRIIVHYTHTIAAFSICYIFLYIFENRPPNRFVSYISTISFEIYLYHYMFCPGPVTLFGMTPFWATDCLLVTAVTIGIAIVANTGVKWVRTKNKFYKKTAGTHV